MRPRLVVVVGGVLLAWVVAGSTATAQTQTLFAAAGTTAEPSRVGRVVFTQVPLRAVASSPADVGDGPVVPAGSRIVSYDPADPEAGPTNLTPGFHAAGRPDASFDGMRILFVAKRTPNDPFDVWEMNAGGTGHRRITSDVGNCSAAIYLSTIFTIDAAQPVDQIAFASDAGGRTRSSLYTCRLDGTGVRRITFGPYGESDPLLLGDGRLLFSSVEAPGIEGSVSGGSSGGGEGDRSALWTVNTDGTDVFVFGGAHEPAALRGMPCETPGGRVVYVESAGDDGDGGGRLVAVSRTASLRTRQVVAADPDGLYAAPTAGGDGRLLVSYRPRGRGSWGLHVLDLHGGTRTDLVYDAPDWHELDAVVVRPRPRPPGRSSVVDDRVETGLLYCLDATLSDAAHAPVGGPRPIASLQVFRAVTGDGRATRVSTGARSVGAATGAVPEELLGTARVESDGSFHLEIPASTPLRVQTLDADGRIVQAMRNWFWVMPKEARGCIGCHEDRERSPPNRHVLALRKGPQRLVGPGPAGETTDPPR